MNDTPSRRDLLNQPGVGGDLVILAGDGLSEATSEPLHAEGQKHPGACWGFSIREVEFMGDWAGARRYVPAESNTKCSVLSRPAFRPHHPSLWPIRPAPIPVGYHSS